MFSLVGLIVFTMGSGVRVGRQLALASSIDSFERASGEVVLSELIDEGCLGVRTARKLRSLHEESLRAS